MTFGISHGVVGLLSSYPPCKQPRLPAGLNFTKWEFGFRTRIGQPKV